MVNSIVKRSPLAGKELMANEVCHALVLPQDPIVVLSEFHPNKNMIQNCFYLNYAGYYICYTLFQIIQLTCSFSVAGVYFQAVENSMDPDQLASCFHNGISNISQFSLVNININNKAYSLTFIQLLPYYDKTEIALSDKHFLSL